MTLRTCLAAFAIAACPLQSAMAQDGEDQETAPVDESFEEPDTPPVNAPSEAALAALEMIDSSLKELDGSIERNGNSWQFTLGDRLVIIVTDPIAERMRIMTPIAAADALPPEVTLRLLQANYDSALDARYAVAQNIVWGAFIHNLTGLDKREFQSGLLQTLNVADTFGTTYSSGAAVFGGGDSASIIDEQLEELLAEEEARGAV